MNIIINLTELIDFIADRQSRLESYQNNLTWFISRLDQYLKLIISQKFKSITLVQDGFDALLSPIYFVPNCLKRQISTQKYLQYSNYKFLEDAFQLNMEQKQEIQRYIQIEFPEVYSFISQANGLNYADYYDLIVTEQQQGFSNIAHIIPSFHQFTMFMQDQITQVNSFQITQSPSNFFLLIGDEYFPGLSYKQNKKFKKLSPPQALELSQNKTAVQIINEIISDDYFVSIFWDQDLGIEIKLTRLQTLIQILQRQFFIHFSQKFDISTKVFNQININQEDYNFAMKYFSQKQILSQNYNLNTENDCLFSFTTCYQQAIKHLNFELHLTRNEQVKSSYKELRNPCLKFDEFEYFTTQKVKIVRFDDILVDKLNSQ